MKKYILTGLLLLIYINGFCQDDIFFNFDYSVFKSEDEKSILEVYYSVNQNSLIYENKGSNFEGAALIDIVITNTLDNKVIYSNLFKSPSIVQDTTKKNNQKLIGQINYLLDIGKYKINIIGKDFADTLKTDSFENEVTINKINPDEVFISDIEISSSIKKSDNTQSPFYKNTLEVIPNPSSLFGMNLNELYYYYEIYGLSENNISKEYHINYSVYNLNDQKLISLDKNVNRKSESKADFGKIVIDSLDRGSYKFVVTITDSVKNKNISREKKFFIYKESTSDNLTTLSNDYLKSEYVTMTEEEVEDEYEKMIYVITTKFEDRFEELKELNDKKKLLYDFWRSQDSNPESQILETKIAYFKKVKEANKKFKEAYVDGWKTDRGRIYVIYGKPDDVEIFPFESESRSYETWEYYSLEGGGEFVFIEFQHSTGEYKLVHSSLRTELQNNNWRDLLDKY